MQISVFCYHYESNNDILKLLLENFLPRRDPVSPPVNPKLMAQVRKQNKLPEGNRKQIESLDQRKLQYPETLFLLLPDFKRGSPTFIQSLFTSLYQPVTEITQRKSSRKNYLSVYLGGTTLLLNFLC